MPNSLYHLWILLKRLGVVLLLYFLCRVGFYLFNLNSFSGLSFFELAQHFIYGLRFDLSAIAITNIPVILLSLLPFNFIYTTVYQKLLKIIFTVINCAAILFNIIDWAYFSFTLRRTSIELFSLFSIGDDMSNILPIILLDYWYIILIAAILCYLLYHLYSKIELIENNNRNYILNTAFILFIIVTTVIAARGGLQYKPIRAITAAHYTSAQFVPLVLNTPFTIIASSTKDLIDPKYSEIDLTYYQSSEFSYSKTYSNINGTDSTNVIVFILESFSSEYIGYYSNNKSYTPFLDSILNLSWGFTNSYANAKKSIDALPAIFSGIPSLMNDPLISSGYNSNSVPSIVQYLKNKNYYTSFFHGGNNGTMGFDHFTSLCGFDDYYGRDEFIGNEDDYDGQWGIYDEPFLEFYLNKLSNHKQPFYSSFFSLSSHHPFKMPKKYENTFEKGTLPIHECVLYSDNALRKFFNKAKNEEWYKNTLFVFTADHTGPSKEINYLTKENRYSIPIAYYFPEKIAAKRDHRITQHIDISPTILHLLGYNKSIYSFGVSKLDTTEKDFAITYANNIYQCILPNKTIEYDGDKIIGGNQDDKNIEFIQAIVANYNYRMLNNKLVDE